MKALFFETHGGPEVLKYGEVPDPVPGPGEVVLKVKAVALNHLDIWVRRGWQGLRLNLPHWGGSDVVGELVAIGEGSPTAAFPLGTRVVVNPGFAPIEDEWTRRGEESLSPNYKILGEQVQGGMAELVKVPLKNCFVPPAYLSDEDACASLLVGVTAWRMLFKRGELKPGETVLIVGSGGGVNSLSIMLAKRTGAQVIVLAGSPEKADKAVELGAHTVILYKEKKSWASEVLTLTKGRGVDLVVDNVGAATFNQSIRSARRGGKIVTVGNTSGPEIVFDNRLLFTKQLSLIGSTMGSAQDFLDAMQFIWTQKIKSPIDVVAPMSEGITQLQRLEKGEQFGKIVLKP